MERFAGFCGLQAILRSFLENLTFHDFWRMSFTKCSLLLPKWTPKWTPKPKQILPSMQKVACHLYRKLDRSQNWPKIDFGGHFGLVLDSKTDPKSILDVILGPKTDPKSILGIILPSFWIPKPIQNRFKSKIWHFEVILASFRIPKPIQNRFKNTNTHKHKHTHIHTNTQKRKDPVNRWITNTECPSRSTTS